MLGSIFLFFLVYVVMVILSIGLVIACIYGGVMLIIKPGAEGFQPLALLVLFVSVMTVARDIQSRKIGDAAPPFRLSRNSLVST